MLDANIALQARAPEYQSPVAQYTKLLQLKDLMRQSQMGDIQAQEATAGLREKEAMRVHLAGAPNLDTPEGQAALYGVAPTLASGFLKGRLDLRKTEADIGHVKGQTSKDAATEAQTRQQTKTSVLNQHLQELAGVRNPMEAQRWVQGGLAKGIGDMKTASEAMQGIPQDPIEFERWKHGQRIAGVDLAKQFDLANADRTHGLEVQKFGETGRHNKATENTAAGHLGVSQAQLGLSRRRLALDQSAQNPAGKVDWKQDTNGNWVALPKEIVPGQTVTPTMTTAPGKREVQAGQALGIIEEAKGLINKATGSYIGAGVDQAGRVIGMSSKSSETAAELKALEGALMMAQPRMEGPQSDKDVALYRQMAARIGDSTVPAGEKMAALTRIEAIHRQYSDGPQKKQGQTPSTPNGGYSDTIKEQRYQEWKAKQK